MPFPETERVVFERNPLKEVICQLRFPGILKIHATTPDAYQEAIRAQFPMYAGITEGVLKAPEGVPAELKTLIQNMSQAEKRNIHQFATADGSHKVTLAQDSIALSTVQYRDWHEFSTMLRMAVDTLVELYKPAFLTRIGLRYIDVIERSKLGLSGVGWKELLQPPILGEFADDQVGAAILVASRESTVMLSGIDGQATLRHGLGTLEGQDEMCYVIDADFHRDTQTNCLDAYGTLDTFNRKAGNLFRWCITPRLRDALQPKSVT